MALKEITTNEKYEQWKISNLADFAKFIQANLNFNNFHIFRGQREDKSLLPKIARLVHFNDLQISEKKILDHFMRGACSYIENMPTNEWDLLAIGQHHGLPTRLLDWSKNALAALWFAVRKPSESNSNGVVWCFTPLNSDIIHNFDKASPFRGKYTKVFEPRHVSPRIKVQEGIFTVHKYVEKKEKFIPLEKNIKHRSRLVKIIVPSNCFADIRIDLERCGIHAASLFPDLDGLSEFITWKNSLLADDS